MLRRLYDHTIALSAHRLALPALAVFLFVLSHSSVLGIRSNQINWLLPLFLASILSLSLPVRFIEDVLGEWWATYVTGATTVVLVLLLAVSLLFSRQLGRIYPDRAGVGQ